MANAKASLNLEALPTPPSLPQTTPSDAVLDALKMILRRTPERSSDDYPIAEIAPAIRSALRSWA
jgi:hypothetical protein